MAVARMYWLKRTTDPTVPQSRGASGVDLDDSVLARQLEALRVVAPLGPALACVLEDRVQVVVRVVRVVVEQHGSLDAATGREVQGVRDGGVAPAEVRGVLVVRVLGVV